MGEPGAIAGLALNQGAGAVEPGGGDAREGAAALAADELDVAGRGERVAPCAVPGVEVADEAELLERVEVAVHGREVRGGKPALEAGRDLVGGERPLGGVQGLDHQPPRRRDPEAAAAQQLDSALDGGSGER